MCTTRAIEPVVFCFIFFFLMISAQSTRRIKRGAASLAKEPIDNTKSQYEYTRKDIRHHTQSQTCRIGIVCSRIYLLYGMHTRQKIIQSIVVNKSFGAILVPVLSYALSNFEILKFCNTHTQTQAHAHILNDMRQMFFGVYTWMDLLLHTIPGCCKKKIEIKYRTRHRATPKSPEFIITLE